MRRLGQRRFLNKALLDQHRVVQRRPDNKERVLCHVFLSMMMDVRVHTERVRHCRRSQGRNRGDVPDLSLPPFTDPSRNVSCEFCRRGDILRPRNDETMAREDVEEPFLALLGILHRRTVKGTPKRKYATTRSMRAARLPISSTHQTLPEKTRTRTYNDKVCPADPDRW